MPSSVRALAASERTNLREWVATVLGCEVAELGVEPTESAIDVLTQVIECRAQEIAKALLSVPSRAEPTCKNCSHPWDTHINSGHMGDCRDVVSDGSRCGCTRFIDSTTVPQEGE